MDFSAKEDLTCQSGARTRRGTCVFNGDESDCVQKTYTSPEEFARVKQLLSDFRDQVRELGPDILFVDDRDRAVYMEFVDCDTLSRYLAKIDVIRDENDDRGKLTALLSAIAAFLVRLGDHQLCHHDLHQGNMLVCVTDEGFAKTIKMIDLDTLKLKQEESDEVCDDYQTIGESIFFCLVARHRGQEDYQQKLQTIREIVAGTDIDPSLKQFVAGR